MSRDLTDSPINTTSGHLPPHPREPLYRQTMTPPNKTVIKGLTVLTAIHTSTIVNPRSLLVHDLFESDL